MPKHIVRLFALMVAFIVLALVAKSYFTPDSFYQFGHYRGDSVTEIASDMPKFRGPDYCLDCHEDRHAEWTGGSHKVVKCEVCHGAVAEHPDEEDLPVVPSDSVKLCTLCHESMPTRPAAQPQIVVAEHAGEEQCVLCHDPHSPRIPGADGEDTGPVAECAACHGDDGRGVGDFPPLAGLDAGYLTMLMREYRSGARQSPIMNTIAEGMSDADIERLADHYAALKAGAAN
jgi:cytochrome c553